jgi:hypothetical protein
MAQILAQNQQRDQMQAAELAALKQKEAEFEQQRQQMAY